MSTADPLGTADLRVDGPISAARPLPGRYYTTPAAFAHDQSVVFGRAWNVVAHAGQLADPGSYVTASVAGQPVAVVRDGERLRAYHNVCRHRGGPLTEGCGRQRQFTCRYHGWSYALDGRLLRAPSMAEETAAHGGSLDLRPVQVSAWAGLVFVNLDPAAQPLPDFLGTLAGIATELSLERMRFVMRRSHPVAANWKVYVDNYLEGYHVPVVHPALNRELDFRAYVTELGDHHSCQRAPIAGGDAAGRVYSGRESGAEARYYWLYPNLMLNVYQGMLQTNVVEPTGVDSCLVHFDWFGPELPGDAAAQSRLGQMYALSDEVQAEDARICAAVQRNLGSPAFAPGPYSVQHEAGVHHFHQLYARALRAGAPAAPSRACPGETAP